MARQVKRTSGVFNNDGWYGCIVYDINDIVFLDIKGNIMMAPKYVSQVNLIRWGVVGITMAFQVYLMWKYKITWIDVVLWGIILSGAYTLVRISSVTEGMVQTVIKQEMYNKVKSMLFKDDERNTPDRFHK